MLRIAQWLCLRLLPTSKITPWSSPSVRYFTLGSTEVPFPERSSASPVPFRKQLKDEKRRRRLAPIENNTEKPTQEGADRWELTVGLEIHAQLNTRRKLFSSSQVGEQNAPNTNVNAFDIAAPGAQPLFQTATLVPAIRAALALGCQINRTSQFDRKHYFYHDQPAGYQITQYYKPLAVDGAVILSEYDGIGVENGRRVEVGIKQVQMEQDTAKSNQHSATSQLVDFNRAGHPLIEIITLPHIHHPKVAAACVKKIQALLQAVHANEAGIEVGGLRADVNVSVRPKHPRSDPGSLRELGQRTEIKNLVSFQAVEDAILAERDRQIRLLTAGERITGETRGWTLGAKETTSLRSKEGEVDYRYMPDPDLSSVHVSEDLVAHLKQSLPQLPDDTLADLTTVYGLSILDAKALMTIDSGRRLEYFDSIYDLINAEQTAKSLGSQGKSSQQEPKALGKLVANWTLHEVGSLLTFANATNIEEYISTRCMADILISILAKHITTITARQILRLIFSGDKRSVQQIIQEEELGFKALSKEEYQSIAQAIILQEPAMVKKAKADWALGKQGGFMWFVGQVMRRGGKSAEAAKAKVVLEEMLALSDIDSQSRHNKS